VQLQSVIKYVERVGDHAANLGETVVLMVRERLSATGSNQEVLCELSQTTRETDAKLASDAHGHA